MAVIRIAPVVTNRVSQEIGCARGSQCAGAVAAWGWVRWAGSDIR